MNQATAISQRLGYGQPQVPVNSVPLRALCQLNCCSQDQNSQSMEVPVVVECSSAVFIHEPFSTSSPESEASFICGGLRDNNYPAGACTEHYWACVDGIAMDRQCPIETVFDDESDNWEPMSTVPTCDGIRDASSAVSSDLSGNQGATSGNANASCIMTNQTSEASLDESFECWKRDIGLTTDLQHFSRDWC